MNKLAYPLFIWKSQRGFAIFSMVVMAALQFLVIVLISTLDVAPILTVLLEQLPERFRTLINEELLTRLSLKGAAAFGFNHPLVLALLAINAINIPNRHIAGEIETGTLELLLAYPMQRTRLVFSLWISASLLLFLIVFGAWISSLTAITVLHKLSFDLFMQMLKIGSNLWLLFVLIMSYTLLISTFGKEGSKIGIRSAGITLIFYFLHLLSTLWNSIDFIRPFNIFTYYQPLKLMFDQRNFWLNFGVLITLIGVCLLVSIKQFNRRDIPG